MGGMPWQYFDIKYKGVFDIDDLVKLIVGWFQKYGYEHYIYQSKGKVGDFGAEEEVGIKGWVNETEYHRLTVDVYFHVWDANPVEIIQDGKKKTMIKGAVQVNGKGQLIMDFTNRFGKSKMMMKLRDFMNKYVINERYGTIYDDDLHFKVQELGNEIKQFFNMSTDGKYW